jgi:predicted 3-demethylubiquinone-9 3-methyltransferase (glyoxalase superfamily)
MPTTQKVIPFLWFDTQAHDAAKFYVSVFKKKSKIVSVSRYGDAGPGPKGAVMVVEFQLQGQTFHALNAGPVFKFTPAISFVVSCKTQKEVDYYWDKLLANGGTPSQCGWLTDRYGLSWQIVPEMLNEVYGGKDAAKSARVMASMLKMVKLDIATLKKAAAAAPPPPRKVAKGSPRRKAA